MGTKSGWNFPAQPNRQLAHIRALVNRICHYKRDGVSDVVADQLLARANALESEGVRIVATCKNAKRDVVRLGAASDQLEEEIAKWRSELGEG